MCFAIDLSGVGSPCPGRECGETQALQNCCLTAVTVRSNVGNLICQKASAEQLRTLLVPS